PVARRAVREGRGRVRDRDTSRGARAQAESDRADGAHRAAARIEQAHAARRVVYRRADLDRDRADALRALHLLVPASATGADDAASAPAARTVLGPAPRARARAGFPARSASQRPRRSHVSTIESGFSDRLSMPWATSHSASSG